MNRTIGCPSPQELVFQEVELTKLTQSMSWQKIRLSLQKKCTRRALLNKSVKRNLLGWIPIGSEKQCTQASEYLSSECFLLLSSLRNTSLSQVEFQQDIQDVLTLIHNLRSTIHNRIRSSLGVSKHRIFLVYYFESITMDIYAITKSACFQMRPNILKKKTYKLNIPTQIFTLTHP